MCKYKKLLSERADGINDTKVKNNEIITFHVVSFKTTL